MFSGTRVPVETLFDYLEGQETVDEFIEDFPTVSRAQVLKFLEQLKAGVVHSARAA